MKIAGVLPIFILALCAMECSVSALHIKKMEIQREFQNDAPSTDVDNDPERDPGILENIEDEASDPCGHLWTRYEEYCYHVSDQLKTQEEAQEYCDETMDANLAKIYSEEENSFVLDLVNKHASSANKVWIGLEWESGPKDYYWYDHSVPYFTNWAPDEPNGNASEPCVEMYVGRSENLPHSASGYWNDFRCDVLNGMVCKKVY